jgi:ABC-type multidrug transport system fused ATPase/permease subunit
LAVASQALLSNVIDAATQTVHTAGINLEGALTTAALVVALLTPLFALLLFVLRSFISSAIELALKPVWTQLDLHNQAIAKLQGIEEGKRFMQEQDRRNATGGA